LNASNKSWPSNGGQNYGTQWSPWPSGPNSANERTNARTNARSSSLQPNTLERGSVPSPYFDSSMHPNSCAAPPPSSAHNFSGHRTSPQPDSWRPMSSSSNSWEPGSSTFQPTMPRPNLSQTFSGRGNEGFSSGTMPRAPMAWSESSNPFSSGGNAPRGLGNPQSNYGAGNPFGTSGRPPATDRLSVSASNLYGSRPWGLQSTQGPGNGYSASQSGYGTPTGTCSFPGGNSAPMAPPFNQAQSGNNMFGGGGMNGNYGHQNTAYHPQNFSRGTVW